MNETPERERNPRTHDAHKRETFWQITFPLIIGLVLALILAALTLVAATGGGSIKQAADASLIFLIIPLMVVTILFIIIFGAVAYGLVMANKELPFAAHRMQGFFMQVREQVQIGSDKAVEPILKIRSFLASIETLTKRK